MMDDPRHAQIRRLVSSGLTPRMIRLVEDDLRSRTRALLDAVEPGVPFDFLVDVAAELPMQMICILLGVPESERHWLVRGDRTAIRPRSLRPAPRDGADVRLRRRVDRRQASRADRRHAVGGGERLATCGRLCGTGAVPVLQPAVQRGCGDHAQRRRRWTAGADRASRPNAPAPSLDPDAVPTAIEEMVRWTSPSPSKRRTATRDVSSADVWSRPGRRCRSGRARRTATRRYSSTRTSST